MMNVIISGSIHEYCHVYKITGNDLELCYLSGCLEKAQLDCHFEDDGDTLVLEEDKPQEKIINFLRAFCDLRNLPINIVTEVDAQ